MLILKFKCQIRVTSPFCRMFSFSNFYRYFPYIILIKYRVNLLSVIGVIRNIESTEFRNVLNVASW